VAPAERAKKSASRSPRSRSPPDTAEVIGSFAESAARGIGGQLGRQLVRGILGSIGRGR